MELICLGWEFSYCQIGSWLLMDFMIVIVHSDTRDLATAYCGMSIHNLRSESMIHGGFDHLILHLVMT